MDKLREEFEKWLAEEYGFYGEDVETQESLGINLAFDAWKASRASIVAELPEYRSAESYQSAGYNEALDDCGSALRSIGLSIKGE